MRKDHLRSSTFTSHQKHVQVTCFYMMFCGFEKNGILKLGLTQAVHDDANNATYAHHHNRIGFEATQDDERSH